MTTERIASELADLKARGIDAEHVTAGSRPAVIYRSVPTADGAGEVDVIVPVPDGYPGAMIDLAGLRTDDLSLLQRAKGGTNPQGDIVFAHETWRLASYHPHQNGGGPPWNPMKHGFHTYYDHLVAWLHALA